jgi:hypothetical protein
MEASRRPEDKRQSIGCLIKLRETLTSKSWIGTHGPIG